MPRTSTKLIIERLNKLDFHDDGLKSVKIYPPHKSTTSARIDLEFRDDSTGAMKLLSFRDCRNVRYIMDFDVLANNWFAQTERVVSTADVARMERFVRAQKAHWHVQYMAPSPDDKPIRKKLATIKKYLLFKITFFGGTIEILAREFTTNTKGGIR